MRGKEGTTIMLREWQDGGWRRLAMLDILQYLLTGHC